MNRIKETLLTNWHLMRIVRLGLGTMMLAMGIQNKDWAMGLFSVFFLYQAITNTGCCGSGACYTPPSQREDHKQDITTIEYEEIK